jgi:flagellar protein FlaG
MDISSIMPGDSTATLITSPPAPDAAARRELVAATRTVNASDVLGANQLVFMVDPQTRKPVIRVQNRDTHEVVLQLPPDYVLRLAEELRARTQIS